MRFSLDDISSQHLYLSNNVFLQYKIRDYCNNDNFYAIEIILLSKLLLPEGKYNFEINENQAEIDLHIKRFLNILEYKFIYIIIIS